jgi:hypothetical protein
MFVDALAALHLTAKTTGSRLRSANTVDETLADADLLRRQTRRSSSPATGAITNACRAARSRSGSAADITTTDHYHVTMAVPAMADMGSVKRSGMGVTLSTTAKKLGSPYRRFASATRNTDCDSRDRLGLVGIGMLYVACDCSAPGIHSTNTHPPQRLYCLYLRSASSLQPDAAAPAIRLTH